MIKKKQLKRLQDTYMEFIEMIETLNVFPPLGEYARLSVQEEFDDIYGNLIGEIKQIRKTITEKLGE